MPRLYDLGHHLMHDRERLPYSTFGWLLEGYGEVTALPEAHREMILAWSRLIAARALLRGWNATRPARSSPPLAAASPVLDFPSEPRILPAVPISMLAAGPPAGTECCTVGAFTPDSQAIPSTLIGIWTRIHSR
ncbi:MAG: hypothetical protein R2849_11895 [Thermomicrobiales bacterium]